MQTSVLKPIISPKTSASVHYLSEDHSNQISKIAGIQQLAAGSPLVQIAFNDSKGQISLLEATLEKDHRGYYLTSNGYSENSRNWPEKDMQITRIDQLLIIDGGEFAKVNLLQNPQNLEQAFGLSAGTAIGVKAGYEYKDMFILSVDKNGIINAVELTSVGPLTDSYYRINEKAELIRCDGEDEYSSGKIKSVDKLNSKMRLNLTSGQTREIEICNDSGHIVGHIAPHELIQAGTQIKIVYSTAANKNEIQTTGYWHGVQHGSAVISDKNNLNVRSIPMEQITQIDNFGPVYNIKEDLAVLLAPKNERTSIPGAYTVYTGNIASSQIPFNSGTTLFSVGK